MRPSQAQDGQNPSSTKPVLTTGEILPDGTVLEIVRVRDQTMLHVWRNGNARLATRYETAGTIYEPLPLDASVLAAVRLATASVGYGSVAQLFDSMLSTLARFTGLAGQDLTAAGFWILASWFPEVLPVPTLIVSSPSPADARKFLRLLRCFCRRGVHLTEVSAGGFLCLPTYLSPTLLVEQARVDRRTRGLFRGSAAGNYVSRAGKFRKLGFAQAIACEQDDLDVDLREGSMTVCLFPPPAEVPVFDRFAEETLAAEFQPRLLRFRCKNFRKVADSTFDAPGFTTGIRDLARAFGARVIGDETLQAGIISLLGVQDGDVRATFANRPDVAIVVALLTLIHERQQRISVTGLTAFVNAVLRAGGEIREYGPLEIGRFLSRLGIPRARNAGGMVIDLTRDVSLRVHLLKRRCGVITTPASFPGCPDCERAGVSADRQLVQVVQEV